MNFDWLKPVQNDYWDLLMQSMTLVEIWLVDGRLLGSVLAFSFFSASCIHGWQEKAAVSVRCKKSDLQLAHGCLALLAIDQVVDLLVVLLEAVLVLGVVGEVDGLVSPRTHNVEFGVKHIAALQA